MSLIVSKAKNMIFSQKQLHVLVFIAILELYYLSDLKTNKQNPQTSKIIFTGSVFLNI